jgi:hypothetical protein
MSKGVFAAFPSTVSANIVQRRSLLFTVKGGLCKQGAKNAFFQCMRCACPGDGSRCLQALLSEWDGKLLNASAIGRRLGISHGTAMRLVKGLAKQGTVRILPSFDNSRRPLLYVPEAFLGSCVDAVIKELARLAPESRFFWWKTRRVRQIQLLAEVGQRRLGFCFCMSGMPQRKDRIPLQIAHRRGLIQKGYILHSGSDARFFRPALFQLPFVDFLCKPACWINPWDPATAVRRINSAANALYAPLFCGM